MLTLFANLSSWADIKDLKTTQYRDTSLCSYVLLRACPKNDWGRWVNRYIITFILTISKLGE